MKLSREKQKSASQMTFVLELRGLAVISHTSRRFYLEDALRHRFWMTGGEWSEKLRVLGVCELPIRRDRRAL